MPLLEVKDLRTHFDTPSGTVAAVDGISFTLDAGQVLGLVGESGSGKSITALSLLRLVPPPGRIVGGEILFDGRDIVTMTNRDVRAVRGAGISIIFQDPMTSLNPVLTVGRQIAEAVELHLGMRRGPARGRAIELLERVGIPNAEHRAANYPHQFSGGMLQRAMIAMALSCNPRLLIADEPTTALDVTVQAQILDLLKKLISEFQTSLLLITHDLGVVAGMAQQVHVMYAGKVVERAGTEELFGNPKMPYTWGLLRSIPPLEGVRPKRLLTIEGIPPDLSIVPPGCRFEARCTYRRDLCAVREPDLVPAADALADHATRCWGTQLVGAGGWLRTTDWRTDMGSPDALSAIQEKAALQSGGDTVEP